jgi:hypothetical protein
VDGVDRVYLVDGVDSVELVRRSRDAFVLSSAGRGALHESRPVWAQAQSKAEFHRYSLSPAFERTIFNLGFVWLILRSPRTQTKESIQIGDWVQRAGHG